MRLKNALEKYAKADRCQSPIKKQIPDTRYKEHWILSDYGFCQYYKAKAALRREGLVKRIKFCKRTDKEDHPSCYYRVDEKPVWGDWIDNGTGVDYYTASDVDNLIEHFSEALGACINELKDPTNCKEEIIRIAKAALGGRLKGGGND